MPDAMTTPSDVAGLYAHVPYCHSICGYCDFYSEVLDRGGTGRLVAALLAELEQARSAHRVRPETLFVGGGTPTTLPPDELRRLLAGLRACAADAALLEFTVEANPATVTPEIADVLAAAGVTRVSIGAQSFDRSELRVLERIHRPEQVAETVRCVRAAGIREVNLDLIFAVPGQSLESWLRNLHQALELGVDHLSCYGLTYEKGTPLFDQLASGQVRRADADLEADMYEATLDALAAAGFEHYEISNFARPGRRCRHNLLYWRNEPHLGLGPSAAGFVGELRYRNVPDTAEYVRSVEAGRRPRVQQERLSREHRARETMMLQLRLIEGVPRGEFRRRFGGDPAEIFAEVVERHVALGLLSVTDERIALTRRGLLLADSVIADFLVPQPAQA